MDDKNDLKETTAQNDPIEEYPLRAMLDELPEQERDKFSKFIYSSFQMRNTSPDVEIASKLNESQLTQIIKNQAEETRQYFNDRKHARWFIFGAFSIVVVFLLVLVLILKSAPDVMEKVIFAIGGILAGGFGGYGLGKSKGKDQD